MPLFLCFFTLKPLRNVHIPSALKQDLLNGLSDPDMDLPYITPTPKTLSRVSTKVALIATKCGWRKHSDVKQSQMSSPSEISKGTRDLTEALTVG